MSVAISGPPESIRGSRVDVRGLTTKARLILKGLDLSRAELSVALVGDAEIRVLNRDYRNRPRATDVLSFSLVEGDHSDHRRGMLGDVVISVETAARQAADLHKSLDERVIRLLIHGVLHLIGHDHVDDNDAREMAVEERRLWQALKR